jgi:AcrR family transcriptional regulator
MAGVRERARAELLSEIKRLAREQLAETGASAISLRQIARDLDMVSSAIYRYYPSRDELLTALIIEAYDALGETAEAADRQAVAKGKSPRQRWLSVTMACREWATKNPAEYALIYGSPVPGYQAPQDTIASAVRLAKVLINLLVTQHQARAFPSEPGNMARPLRADLKRLVADADETLPETVMLRALTSWVQLLGLISFELFGHLHGVIGDKGAFFEHQMNNMADYIGLE